MQKLKEQKLRRSAAVEVRILPDGIRLMKQTARLEYLALDGQQQRILDRFDGNQTVQEILQMLLMQGESVKLRGFYDLILNACNKGFLFEGEQEPSGVLKQGRQWPVLTSPAATIGLFLGLMITGISVFITLPVQSVTSIPEWMQVLAMVAAGISVAHLLAGCALSGLGRQVYGPVLRLDHGLPYLHVDTRDAFMGGRLVEGCVALEALAAPFLVAIAAGIFDWPFALLAAWITLLVLASPFGNTPAHQLLHGMFRKEYQLPRCAERFLNTKMFAQLFNFREQLKEEKYFLVYSTYAILWLGLLYRFSTRMFETQGNAVAQLLSRPAGGTDNSMPMITFALLAGLVAAPLAYGACLLLRGLYRLLAPRLFNTESSLKRADDSERPSLEAVAGFLQQTLLFGQLPSAELAKVADAMKYLRVAAGSYIVRERDLGNLLFVVHQGTVEVLKETEAGNQQRVATLGAGDVFGEIAVLDQVPRTSSVRCTQDTTLLTLTKDDFDKLLLSTLGAKGVRDAVQVCGFLKRNPLFAEWHPQPLFKLSSAFEFQHFQAGDIVIHENQANEAFFLVHEGQFEVRKKGQACATLGPGDFCGEVSLLRNQPASAQVSALKAGRCLRLGKTDFLKLMSEDFLTGLAIENVLDLRTAPGGAR